MSNTKKVTISLTPEQQEKARSLSKDLFGKENISGLVGFLIERWEKEQKTSTNIKSKRSGSMAHNAPAACRSVAILKTNLSNLKYTLYEK